MTSNALHALPASRSMLEQLVRIFGMIEDMRAVDVAAVEPMAHAQNLALRLRDDVITESDQRELFQSVAPRVENGLYLVPKVIE
jgi:aspartyl-tRNA(Asn)/glutamyl-tRNA(Gln) amidotransferase subunit C